MHELDELRAKGQVPGPKGLGDFKIAPLLGFLLFGLRNGLMRVPPILEVATFGDGATLDVPGEPRVIHVPGHTAGSAALHFAGRDADNQQAFASLSRFDRVDARLVLAGHGDVWDRGLPEAVRVAHERWTSGR